MVKSKYIHNVGICAILLFIAFGALPVYAATSFQLIPVRDAVQGRRFQVVYQLTTDDQSIANSLQIVGNSRPEIENCKLYYGPASSTMFSTSIINGNAVSECVVQLTYTYLAENPGTVTVPSLSVSAGGKTYKSKTQSIKIVADSNAGAQNSQGGNRGGQSPQTGNISVGSVTSKDLMVNISFSRHDLYEQEAVVASIKLYLRYDRQFGFDGSTFRALQLPVFDGFLSEDLPVRQGSQIENYNGNVYETIELKRVLLFPQKSGTLRVSSGNYEVTVIEYEWVTYGFHRTRREVPRKMSTATNTATIQVKSLPQPRPADFSGAVGKFEVSSELNPEILRTNEAATYSLIVKGTGNIKYLTAPEMTFPSTFDKYSVKTDIQADYNGTTYAGTYRIDYPFVPQEMGKFTIAPKPFVYFDPSAHKYVTVETKGYDVNVTRGSAVNVSGAQKEVDATMNDILHIHALDETPEVITTPVALHAWYWILYLIAFCSLVTTMIVYRRHLKRSADIAGRRLARANRVANKRFKTAKSFMNSHKSDEFYEELANALKGYLGDKLGIPPSQLISDTISSRLVQFGVAEETAADVLAVLNDCEMARFTPSQSDEAMSDIYNRASSAIKAIEEVKK